MCQSVWADALFCSGWVEVRAGIPKSALPCRGAAWPRAARRWFCHSVRRKHAVVLLREQRQIGGPHCELAANGARTSAIGTMALGAFRQKFDPPVVVVLSPNASVGRDRDSAYQ